MTARALFAAGFAAALAVPAAASDFTLSLQGAYAVDSHQFSGSRTFTLFQEEGRIDGDFDSGTGPGFEAGLTWNFKPHLGVGVSGGLVARDGSATFHAVLPHPLFLDRDRVFDGTLDSVDRKEVSVHLDLVYTGSSGAFEYSAFAGPSFYSVSVDLLGEPQFAQTYPFDIVSDVRPPRFTVDDTGFGFNVGAGIAYRFSHMVGFGFQGRYSQASLELIPAVGQGGVSVDAGGFQVSGGLRLYF
jgi:opacity protein-like surface antigen